MAIPGRNMKAKREVVIMNMKMAFMSAIPNFCWKDEGGYVDKEEAITKNFQEKVDKMSKMQVDALYDGICGNSQLIYDPNEKVFQLERLLDS